LSANSLLSALKQDELRIKSDQAIAESSQIKYSNLSPIIATYENSTTKSDSTKESTHTLTLSYNQPIFKSGAIYYSIKYANALKEYNRLSIDIDTKSMQKDVISLIYSLKRIDLEIEKQKYLIANALIDVDNKKEQYKEGIIDSSFLDNALLVKNSNMIALTSLRSSRKDLLNSLANISDISYSEYKDNEYTIPTKEQYGQNLNVKLSLADTAVKTYQKKESLSNELVTVSLNTNYTKSYLASVEDSYYYGMSITLPLDINSSNRVQISKLELLSSQNSYRQIQNESSIEYDTLVSKLKLLDKKIELANKSYRLYTSLIKDSKESYISGLEAIDDLNILKNSASIKRLDKKIYEYDKKMILLELNYLVD
jgi:outer membrane protein TolC